MYVVKKGTIGLRIFSTRLLSLCVGLLGPATIGRPFKSSSLSIFKHICVCFYSVLDYFTFVYFRQAIKGDNYRRSPLIIDKTKVERTFGVH